MPLSIFRLLRSEAVKKPPIRFWRSSAERSGQLKGPRPSATVYLLFCGRSTLQVRRSLAELVTPYR